MKLMENVPTAESQRLTAMLMNSAVTLPKNVKLAGGDHVTRVVNPKEE